MSAQQSRAHRIPRCRVCGDLVADARHPCANCLRDLDLVEGRQ